MRRQLPLVVATGGIVCIIVAAALSLTWVLGDNTVESEVARMPPPRPTADFPAPPAEPIAHSLSRSCFWSRGTVRWCLDRFESEEWSNSWAGDEWSITQYEGDSRYYVYNHKDEVLGYLRPATRGGWRAMVLTCFTHPPKGWSRQGCGYVRDGRAIPASRNVLHVYTKGRRVGIARGPGAIAVAAYKLVLGDM